MPATPSIVTAKKICGENTDVIGFTAPLRKRSLPPETRVLVLGAGGVSRAAIAGLRRLGLANITLTNRRKERAEALCNEFRFAVRSVGRARRRPLLTSSSTRHHLGMTGAQEHETPYPRAFQDNGIAYDLIYTPFQTRFLRDAAAAGWETVSGLDMFIGQGDAQFPPVDGAPSSGRSHNGGDFRALRTIKNAAHFHFPHKPAHFKKYGKRLNFPPYCFPQKLLSGGTPAGQPPPPAESLWDGGGLEGKGFQRKPFPSNLSFIQRPHHLFRSNGLHTRMVAITVLLAVQRTGATIQLRLKNPILRPRREKSPILPSWAQTAPKRECRPPPREMHRAGISRDQ